MKKVLFAASIILSVTPALAGNWSNSSNITVDTSNIVQSISPQNFIISKDVMTEFSKVKPEVKAKFCTAKKSRMSGFTDTSPVSRIRGWNSKMSNPQEVEGNQDTQEFTIGASAVMTSVWAMDDDLGKEKALDTIYKWAQADAWKKTYRCRSSNSCGAYWGKSDGSDPYPGHDESQSIMFALHIGYAYYTTLSNYYPEDSRHAVIKEWISHWVKTRSPQFDNLGLDAGWRWPSIFANTSKGKVNKNQIENLVTFIDRHFLDDGSIKNRTTRGNRSLWYHHTGMIEAMISMEIANSHGVKFPKKLMDKIEKAADIFVKGYADHSYMDKWAKVAHNSVYKKPGYQDFNGNVATRNGKSWLYIFMYRFPNSPVTPEIAKILKGSEASAVSDMYIGFGLGCVYGSLSVDKMDMEPTKPFSGKIVEEKVQRKQTNKFSGYGLKLDTGIKLGVMVDWMDRSGDRVAQVRLKVKKGQGFNMTPEQEISALGCGKGSIVTKDGAIMAVKLHLGEWKFRNQCVLELMDKDSAKSLKSIIAGAHDIFSSSTVLPKSVVDYTK